MIFCSNCGAQMADNTKICSACGSLNTNASTRQQEYSGKIIKCPNCGETLQSFVTLCPTCGYELRGANATSSVKEFSNRFLQATTIGQKIDLIMTFAIPNTKEDILEFIILASSNIDADAYESADEKSVSKSLANAWLAKFEQAYQKGKMLFDRTPEFEKIQRLYDDRNRKVIASKKVGKNKSRNLGMVAMGLLFVLVTVGVFIGHIIEERELKQLAKQVEEYIAAGDYQNARIKANQIIADSDWSHESREKWDRIRESLIEIIEEHD